MARIFAETGVKSLFQGILHLLCKYQDKARMVRMVMSVLEKQGIEAQRVREIEVRKQARIAFEQALKCKNGQSVWWVAPVYQQAEIAFRRMKTQVNDRDFFGINDLDLQGGLLLTQRVNAYGLLVQRFVDVRCHVCS